MSNHAVARPKTQKTPDQLRAMGPQQGQAEVDRLTQILAPATEQEIAAALAFLFLQLPMDNAPDPETVKIKYAGYKIAIRGYPAWAIIEARDAFIGGRVDGFTSSFAPNSADLGREVARRIADDRVQLVRAQRALEDARDFKAEDRRPMSAETRAYVNEALARMEATAAKERRIGGGFVPNAALNPYRRPLTCEREWSEAVRFPITGKLHPPLRRQDLRNVPDAKRRADTSAGDIAATVLAQRSAEDAPDR